MMSSCVCRGCPFNALEVSGEKDGVSRLVRKMLAREHQFENARGPEL